MSTKKATKKAIANDEIMDKIQESLKEVVKIMENTNILNKQWIKATEIETELTEFGKIIAPAVNLIGKSVKYEGGDIGFYAVRLIDDLFINSDGVFCVIKTIDEKFHIYASSIEGVTPREIIKAYKDKSKDILIGKFMDLASKYREDCVTDSEFAKELSLDLKRLNSSLRKKIKP